MINRLETYSVREARAFEEHGKALGAKTQDQFDHIVGNSFDNDLANEKFLVQESSERVTISKAQARVLGLNTRPTKGELMSKLDDYGDYLVHKEAMKKAIEERIQTAANYSYAKEELYRTASLKFHIDPAEGINAHRNWYNVIHKLKETYDVNPDKADRELIRLAASVLDPTPWLRAQLAPGVKFTLGMTSRGRADLAVRIYDKVKHGRMLSETEAKWAEQLGMDFAKLKAPESIQLKHVVRAFQPRITYQPGGLFSGTIAIKNGKIVPLIRLYPDGTFGRLIHLEAKLRAGAVEDFIKALRSHDLPLSERWVDALSHVAQEDLITSINVFRNSPLQVSLRMVGVTPDSFAIRALPDNDWLRYSYRFTLNTAQRTAIQTEVRNRLLAGESMDDIVTSLITGPTKDLTAHKTKEKIARELVRKEAAQIAKRDMDNWVEGITILPNLGGGFTLNGISISQKEALIKLKLLGNNLLIIGKKTHYGYDQLLEMWKETKTLFDDFIKTVSESQLGRVRSFDDATKLLGDAFRRKGSRIDIISGEDLTEVDLSFASPQALKNPALRDDLAKFRLAWERQFPNGPLPEVHIVDVLDNPLEARPGAILIRKDVADDWELLGRLRRKAVRLGHFPPDTEASVNNLIHEATHATLLNMDDKTLEFLMRRAMQSQSWPGNPGSFANIDMSILRARLRSEPYRRRIARTLSGYGSTSIDEFLSEAITEYFGSASPRAIATTVGDNFTELMKPVIKPKGQYGWEKLTKKEITDLYDNKIAQHINILEASEKVVAPGPPTHAPTWWWLDNAPVGLEDLEIDKILLNNPELTDDITEGMLDIVKLFPNTKLPRIGYHPTQVGTPLQPVNAANMYYHRAEKNLFVTQHNFENYRLGRELRALGERIGWSPKGTASSANTVVHEMGHVFVGRMNEGQFVKVLDFLRNSDLMGAGTKKELSGIFKDTLNFAGNNGSNSSEGLQNNMGEMLNDWIQNDTTVRTKVSRYGASNLQELLAEAFLDGVNNIKLGNVTTTTKLVRLIQTFGL